MARGITTPAPIRHLVVADCLRMPVREVSGKWDVPIDTIVNWLEELGGVTYLREVHAAQTVAASATISLDVADRIHNALATMTEDNLVSLALKVLDVANRPQAKGEGLPSVTFNNNPTAAIQQNSEATPTDDQVLGIVAALAESGALTEAMARFIHPEAETTDGD